MLLREAITNQLYMPLYSTIVLKRKKQEIVNVLRISEKLPNNN